MPYNPEIHHRRSIRLRNYNYSQNGAYFVTLITKNRENLFGEIKNGEMILNDIGRVVEDEWLMSQKIRKEIELDEYCIMPNHFHAIVSIVGANGVCPDSDGECHSPLRKSKSLSSLMAGFKSSVTKKINIVRDMDGLPVWQRNYYEHIVRNESDLRNIRQYIIQNPLNWENDDEFMSQGQTVFALIQRANAVRHYGIQRANVIRFYDGRTPFALTNSDGRI